MFVRKALMAAAVATLFAFPAAATAQDAGETGIFEDGSRFPYHYLVEFWRENPPGTTLSDDADENAPGVIQLKPATFVHDPKLPKSEVAIIERKLTIISDALLALPPLKDIRGSSISTAINISRDAGTGRTEATLAIGNYPISLHDPKTFNRDGRYHTPGEAPWLTITFNKPLYGLTDEPIEIVGSYNGLQLQRVGATFAGFIVNVPRSLTVSRINTYSGASYDVMNPAFFDPKARPSDLQLLTMKVGLSSLERNFEGGAHPPTGGAARLLSALFMADWADILERVNAVH